MQNIYNAVYKALTTYHEINMLVDTDKIRRGWQEPVSTPAIRFYTRGAVSNGDDLNRTATLQERLIVTVMADDDHKVAVITNAVRKAMKRDRLQDNGIVFHDCHFDNDSPGTYFDPLRSCFRRDIRFQIEYSVITIT